MLHYQVEALCLLGLHLECMVNYKISVWAINHIYNMLLIVVHESVINVIFSKIVWCQASKSCMATCYINTSKVSMQYDFMCYLFDLIILIITLYYKNASSTWHYCSQFKTACYFCLLDYLDIMNWFYWVCILSAWSSIQYQLQRQII